MKIGILTFHRANNYGAFLQAFALKTYLSSLGHEVEIVDYWPEGHADAYRLLSHSWKERPFIGKIKLLISLILRYNRAKKRSNGMLALVKKYFGLTDIPCYQTPESLTNISYDCVLYGSDQIWWKSTIPNYLGFDPVYWGEYIPKSIKKVAYAPSMGIIDLTEQDKLQISKWLENFDVLSVREVELYNAIHDLTCNEISIVLDPIFLLSKEEWIRLCYPVRRKKYILHYNLIPSVEAERLVSKLKRKFNCDVVELTVGVHVMNLSQKYFQTANAIDFISLVNGAEFVVTSSFHGTAFSILFEKQFYVIGMGRKSGRVSSLLSILKLSDRMLNDSSTASFENDIDYKIVTNRLNSYIKYSKEFLKKI